MQWWPSRTLPFPFLWHACETGPKEFPRTLLSDKPCASPPFPLFSGFTCGYTRAWREQFSLASIHIGMTMFHLTSRKCLLLSAVGFLQFHRMGLSRSPPLHTYLYTCMYVCTRAYVRANTHTHTSNQKWVKVNTLRRNHHQCGIRAD